MDEPTLQLNADVPESLRLRLHSFCALRKVRMQDLIRVLVERMLMEAEGGQPCRFVRETLEKVTPPSKEAPVLRKVVALKGRRPRGDGSRRPKNTRK